MMAKHIRDDPVPPSQRVELPISAAVDRLVLDCLAKEPAERPASAQVLAHSLAGVAGERWGEAEAARWWTQHLPG